jgi:hypothetical protein
MLLHIAPLLDGVTATTTSRAINLNNFENVSVQVLASGISVGNGVFTVLGSNDGVNYKALYFVDNAAAALGTLVNSKTLSANGSDVVYLHNSMLPEFIQVKVVVTTDGAYSCFVRGNKKAR